MKIVTVNDEMIKFSDGSTITYDHFADCCECNYADFDQLDDLARSYDFKGELLFEPVDEAGFRFGDSRRMFFVPCYSEQNGCYSCDIDIYYNGRHVLNFEAEFRDRGW